MEHRCAAFIERLGGRVSTSAAPDKYHCFWIEQWQERFPRARTFAKPALRKKVKDLTNTTELAIEPPKFYANEIDQTLRLGNPFFQEAVFFTRRVAPRVSPTRLSISALWMYLFSLDVFASRRCRSAQRWHTQLFLMDDVPWPPSSVVVWQNQILAARVLTLRA